jgi:hypothetical protein
MPEKRREQGFVMTETEKESAIQGRVMMRTHQSVGGSEHWLLENQLEKLEVTVGQRWQPREGAVLRERS